MTDYTIASPNGGTWSIQSANTAKTGRYHDLMFLQEGASGVGNVFSKARTGLLPGPPGAASTQSPGVGAVSPTTGLNWQVNPFCGVVERSSLVGPYLVQSTAVGSGSVTTADPSQTRVDRLDLQVFDGALGDNGGVPLSRVHVTQGTPGSGTPAAPAGTIPFGWWTIPANTLTLTSGMWTPARKSTGLRGATRFMLEGDSLSDPGFDSGETRDTALFSVLSGGGTIDRWNAATSAWELEIPLPGLHEVSFFSSQNIVSNIPTSLGWGGQTLTSADVSTSAGGPGGTANGIITWVRGGLWQVGVQAECDLPTSNANVSSFRVRVPADTGTTVLGSGSHTMTADSSPIRIAAGTQWSVIFVQQTAVTQAVTGRFRAALLRG